MISVQGLSVEFSSKSLFSDVSYVINKKDKIALVGKNGAGKSTMLKIIAGLQQPTHGIVVVQNDIVVGYLPQQMVLADTKTVREDVREAFNHITELNEDIVKLNDELLERTDYESEEYQKIIDRLTHLNEVAGYYNSENCEAEMEKTLMGLGFARADFDRATAEFSGGWRMRIELAKLLLRKPDVLLLDEPTNHLDIESIQWLENFLKTKADAVVLVSHDRAFIDNVTNRTIEISCGKIYDYSVNYTKFEELRKERVEQQMRAYQNQQKEIKDIEDFIERFRYKPTKAVQVQSRIKQLEKIERIEVDEVDNSHISLKFPPAPRSGDYPVIADDVKKQYGEHLVFENATFTLKRGEKVAFVGKNGEGKSTLVKCIMNEIAFDGELKLGHNVKIGYFAQNQAQLLDGEITVFDTIDHVAVGDIRTKIRDILGAFMFGGEASDKKVKVLSGGEKTRLAMIRLLLEPVNLLILDEPTNHLDMRTKDVLKEALKDFDGTMIVVSHDRDFLNGLVDKVYEFGGGKVREFLGGIYEFLDYKNMDSLRELEKKYDLKLSDSPTKKIEEKQDVSAGKLSYAEQKEREKLIRKAEKEVAKYENEIAEIESKIAEIEDELSKGEAVDSSVYTKHADLQKQLENAMSMWELACEEVEKLRS
jgi:ATP-binding cassette subfamily F protein 3